MSRLRLRIISGTDTHAVRCPGCGFSLLGHRAQGENLGEVERSTKSVIKGEDTTSLSRAAPELPED